jgi:hypothetical protein
LGRSAARAKESRKTGTDPGGGRHAFNGQILPAGNAVRDRYVGKPLVSPSRNPIHYITDPDDPSGECKCGCGQSTNGVWVTGHDQRAIHDRIRRDFGGDVGTFVDWYDERTRP